MRYYVVQTDRGLARAVREDNGPEKGQLPIEYLSGPFPTEREAEESAFLWNEPDDERF